MADTFTAQDPKRTGPTASGAHLSQTDRPAQATTRPMWSEWAYPRCTSSKSGSRPFISPGRGSTHTWFTSPCAPFTSTVSASPPSVTSKVLRAKPGQSAEMFSPPTTSGCVWKLMTATGFFPARSIRKSSTSSSAVPAGPEMSGLRTPGFVR